MLKDISTISKALSPVAVYKPHPRAFAPFGTTPRGQMYNGAVFQLFMYATLFGGAGYFAGRQGSISPGSNGPGKKAIKALRASVKLPGTRRAETDDLRDEMIKDGILQEVDRGFSEKEGSSPNNPTTTDRYLMGALPVGTALTAFTLMYAMGKKNRKRGDRGGVLRRYYSAQKRYDAVLANKLFPPPEPVPSRPSYFSAVDNDSPDSEDYLKDATLAKTAGDFTENWRFTNERGGPAAISVGAGLVGKGADTLGVTTLLGAATMASLIGSFILGKEYAEKKSDSQVKLKAVRKAFESRQTHRYIPKLVMPESIDISREY